MDDSMKSITHKFSKGCGTFRIRLNYDDTEIKHVQLQFGKTGGCLYCLFETIERMTKLVLRHNGTTEEIARELEGLRCPEKESCAWELSKLLSNASGKSNDL